MDELIRARAAELQARGRGKGTGRGAAPPRSTFGGNSTFGASSFGSFAGAGAAFGVSGNQKRALGATGAGGAADFATDVSYEAGGDGGYGYGIDPGYKRGRGSALVHGGRASQAAGWAPAGGRGRGRSRIPCRYFMEGRCVYGDECEFLHAAPNAGRGARAAASGGEGAASAAKRPVAGAPKIAVSPAAARGAAVQASARTMFGGAAGRSTA
eukprot:3570185-Pleurochrysis_carterae.AAC.3